MSSNIQKAFKTKSKLRGMADGGAVRPTPEMLGSGMAQRAGSALQGRRAQLDAAIDAAERGEAPPQTPNPITAAPAKKPEEKSALRSFFGLADGGQIFKNDVGGVPTFTDAKAATAGAKAYTPGAGGGSFSVVGMEPAQRQQMQEQAAQRQAAANAPTTLGGRLDAALGKLNSPLQTAGQSGGSKITLGGELDAALQRTQGVTSPATPAVGAPVDNTSLTKTFSGMSQSAMTDAAQMRDIGVQAGQAAAANVRPAELPGMFNDMAAPEIELADGGKVKGKGGPTDDKVGPVMLSDGEYVLPADTVDIVGRDKLDALRLATHDFVDDSNKPRVSGLRKMANGGMAYPDASGIHVGEELNDPASRRAFQQARAVMRMGDNHAAQAVLNEAIPRQAAPAAAPPAGPPPSATGAAGGGGPAARGMAAAGKRTLRMAGQLAPPALAVYEALSDSPDARGRAMSGQTGLAGAAAGVGSYLGGALTGGTSSAQDIGGLISAMRGEGTGAYHSVPDGEKGWARRLGDTYLPTESAQIMADGVKLTPENQRRADVLRRGGLDLTRPMSDEDFARARQMLGQPSTPSVQGAGSTDDAMGNLRRGEPPGGGFAATNILDIYGRKSDKPGHLGEYVGVGRPAAAEDPIMGEIRSALRGLTDGAGNRGGSGFSGRDRVTDEINKRYDDLLRNGKGRNRVRGLDWSQRHGLNVERARAKELGEYAQNRSALRGQDMQARMQALQTLGTMANQRSTQLAQAQAAQLKALQDAQKAAEERMEDNAKVFESIADTFAAGDKDKASQYRELLATLPPELHQVAQELAPEDKRAFYTNIVRQQLGRNDGLVLGRDMGATIQNAAIGGLLGRMTRFGNGAGGKAVDRLLGKIPRVGPALSALRPVENLGRFGALIGAAGGAYATPEVENLTRWDPHARDPETGAALPARKDIREAATYGVFDTYLNPFDDSVQTVSGRRTDRPTPDEEEAARRFRSAMRN